MIGRLGLLLLVGWVLACGLLPAASPAQAQAGGPSPVAVPGGPYAGTVGLPVTFTGGDKTALGIATAQYQWSFGDGATAFGQSVTHVYYQPGAYLITLTVTHASGQSNAQTTTAVIAGPGGVNVIPAGVPPFLISAGGPYGGPAGTPLTFNAAATGVPFSGALQFTWSFGDGATALGQIVSHAYAVAGTYLVTVSATAAGQVAVAQASVTISQPAGGPVFPGAIPTSTPPAAGTAVTYPAGWNLVAGPQGTPFPQSDSPLYTFRSGDTSYETVTASSGVQAGYGYWAYFSRPATVLLSGSSLDSASQQAPGGQWVLAGNPSATATVTIRGADSALSWDPQANTYTTVSTLAPGAAAWVYVAIAGAITLAP